MAVPAGVDEARGRVDQQPEPAERALPLEPGDEVVGQPHPLERRAEHELAGMEDERRLVVDLDELGQLLLLLLDVDVRVARVAEDAEVAVDAHVDARRLHQRLVVRLDLDPALAEQAPDRPVGENHRARFYGPVAKGTFSTYRSAARVDAVRAAGAERALSCAARSGPPTPPAPPRRRSSASCSARPRRGALGARFVIDDEAGGGRRERRRAAAKPAAKPVPVKAPRALPDEVRGIHVTMALASLDGKLAEYLELVDEGMNTIELDVKDENGEIGFVPSAVPLAKKVGAARPYYRPREAAQLVHRKGVYLIGRVVIFEDPRLSAGKPELAIKNPDGSVWRNHAGLGWTNPYDKRVWDYNVSIAEVAARAGFDEIQFDYVRFPDRRRRRRDRLSEARRRRRPAG